MKQILASILFVITLSVSFSGIAQSELSDSLWRKDLNYLEKIIEEKYSHLYNNLSKEEFNRQVDELYRKIPELEQSEIIVGFARLIASFKVGHSGIPLLKSMHSEELSSNFHTLPINFYLFSDGLFIEGSVKEFESIVGAKVLEIGNKKVDEALTAIRPVVSAENESYFKAYGISMLRSPEVLHAQGIIDDIGEVRLLIEKEGSVKEVFIPAYPKLDVPVEYGFVNAHSNWVSFRNKEDTPLWLKNLEKPFYFEYLEKKKAVYVRQSKILNGPEKSIAGFYKELYDFVEANPVEKFILDLRLNGGGNNYLNKPILLSIIKSSVNQKGKFITIIGRRTFSAAQNLVNELENYTETSFIGEPTAENVNFFGDIRVEKLPHSGLSVRLSHLWWQDMDPRDKRKATTPEIVIELSSSDYRNNVDPFLEAAFNYHNVLPQTLEQLKGLLVAKKYDEAYQYAMAYKSNPKNANQLKELRSKLNSLGYEYMQANLTLAKAFFKLNIELFPEYANGWDSLGEAYLNNQEFEIARSHYKKAIDINPDGPTAKNALRMINIINARTKDKSFNQ